MKNHFGILGKNIKYTLSPKLHEIIFKKLGIEGKYEVIDTGDFENEESVILDTIKKLRSNELNGINVTIPYKEKIMKYLDKIDGIALEIGAVNTIKSQNGILVGYNTDYYGIIETIKNLGLNINGKTCYVFGTGGSSKAVAKAIENMGGLVIFISRNKENQNTISYDEVKKMKDLELGVNCTPIKLENEVIKNFKKIFDLKYAKIDKSSIEGSSNFVNGLYMLVVQGIKAQEIWQNKIINNYLEIYREIERE